MPYTVCKSGKGYKVYKGHNCGDKGKSFSKKPLPKGRAKAQQSALYVHAPE